MTVKVQSLDAGRRWWLVAAPAIGVLMLAGCGSQHPAAAGKVVFNDGQPVAGGTITFDGRVSAVGEVKPDGTFTVNVDDQNRGVPAGEYKVTVTSSAEYGQKSEVPEKYGDPTRTDLKVTVPPEGKKDLEIKLDRSAI